MSGTSQVTNANKMHSPTKPALGKIIIVITSAFLCPFDLTFLSCTFKIFLFLPKLALVKRPHEQTIIERTLD